MSYRSCPGCGFLVGLDAETCPLCSQGLGAEAAPLAGGDALLPPGAEAMPPPDPDTAVWPERPAPGDPPYDVEAEGGAPPGSDPGRDSPVIPLAVAGLAVLAMLGLTFFGNQERPTRTTAPAVTLPDPEAVAATFPTTVPAGWITYTDPAGAFLAPLPGTPATLEDVDAQGRVRHRLEAAGQHGSVALVWVEVPETPWSGADGASWLEGTARALVPEGAEVTVVVPATLAGGPAVEVRYQGGDGVVGVVGAVGHAERLYRLVGSGTAPDDVMAYYRRVSAGFVLP